MHIRQVVARRSDLSTFLVHLTRSDGGISAKERLRSILSDNRIEARSMFGPAKDQLEFANIHARTQKCVCFTETPLEYVFLLCAEIEGRRVRFEPYGVALPKKLGRQRGINPVWNVDITPGHEWLMNPINRLIQQAMGAQFEESPISRITPFIEQMGSELEGDRPYRKEFWWEREWRHVGNFMFTDRMIVLCPEGEFAEVKQIVDDNPLGVDATFVDPHWGLEQIISRLAGYRPQDSDML
jgi:hypothetical protein